MRERGRERVRGNGSGSRQRRRKQSARSVWRRGDQNRGLYDNGDEGTCGKRFGHFNWTIYNQAIAFYFSNFLEDWTYDQMWKTFLNFGRVYAIYSPRRKNKAGYRFGFVRFLDVKDAKSLERQLDQIWVVLGERKVEQSQQAKESNKERRQVWQVKSSDTSWTGLEFNSKQEDCKWLEGCFVGMARSVEIVPIIQERFYMEGMFSVKVKAMGGKMVLLDGEDKEELKDLMESAADWLSQWFDEICPWTSTMVASERFVWLKSTDHYSGEEFDEASHAFRSKNQLNWSEEDGGEEDADMAIGKAQEIQKIQIVDETSSSSFAEHINELGGGSGESGSSKELCMVKETLGAGAENLLTSQCNHEEVNVAQPVSNEIGKRIMENGPKANVGYSSISPIKGNQDRIQSQEKIGEAEDASVSAGDGNDARGDDSFWADLSRLGVTGKKREVSELVRKEKVEFLAIQETKKEAVDKKLCRSLWESDDLEFVAMLSKGQSAGLICIWQKNVLKNWSSFEGEHYVGVSSLWGEEDIAVNLVDVYVPCDDKEKRMMFDDLKLVITSKGRCWCLMGDFNTTRSQQEKSGDRGFTTGMRVFNEFIRDLELVDLPLIGRKFTWYKPNGEAMSRLNRFLMTEDWMAKWECKTIVEEEWKKTNVQGWKGFCVKEKLKAVKQKLKKWSVEEFTQIDCKINEAKEKITRFDRCIKSKQRRNDINCLEINGKQLVGVEEQAERLSASFSEDEIKKAVWDCSSLKALGPDGFNFRFFREFWETIKKDMVSNPQKIEEYRPISLIGAMYKIVAKLLANRLKEVISHVIGEHQMAFVEGRQLSEAVVMANEIIDKVRRKKLNSFILKMDLRRLMTK
ncbi:hypothetical protein SLEP1_g56592 [Rubroshorea leprosula]|uniref:Reverse transcriptase domain-containing protein n=1 Tax=Rubroshorea leprosula TaxID=152421 RepID=A0AAV5MMN6_9ROSI|nr:hypothetical protein SLEP1_g56592 [Rubroshorea leprosula]